MEVWVEVWMEVEGGGRGECMYGYACMHKDYALHEGHMSRRGGCPLRVSTVAPPYTSAGSARDPAGVSFRL